jgi:hypothetical protein
MDRPSCVVSTVAEDADINPLSACLKVLSTTLDPPTTPTNRSFKDKLEIYYPRVRI